MQRLKLLLLALFVSVNYCFSQCPNADFSLLNDTVCAGVPFSFSNNSTSGNYQWDFCAGDLKTIPQGVNLGSPGGLLSFPQQVKVVLDNGNYYAFVANFFGPNIIRYDFGPSLDNPVPGTFVYPGFSMPIGVDVVKDGNTWYALVADYGNAHLIRMDLGSAIANNTNSSTDLGAFGFSGPRNVKIVNDNGNYFVFVTNDAGNNINKIEFGSSLGNAVVNSSVLTDPTFLFTYGIDIAYSCDLNKYIGFVANNAGNNISVIDFGNSLANAGSVVHTLSMPPGFGDPYSLTLSRDGEDWHLFFVSNSANKLDQFILGNDLLTTTPATGYSDTIGTLNGPRGLCMIKDSSRWYGLITNTSGTTLTKFRFENNCTSSIAYSTDSLPQNVFYTGQGWQQISLNVLNSNGFNNNHVDSVYVSAAPTVNFGFGAACLGQPVSFYDSCTIGQGSISSWQWNFGDGSGVSNLQNPTYVYTIDSTYLVTLTASSDAGCVASFSDSISVHDLPTANFSFINNQCSETPLSFNDLSTTSAGDSVVAWQWNFGDGSPLDFLQNPVHSYDSSGTYSIQLVVYGSSGCSDTIVQSITIKPRPVISFTVSQTCVGEISLFTNGTTISDGSALNYTWDFGDGSPTSNLVSPTYLYPLVPMTYTVQLISSSTNGCADTLLQNLHISTRANPGFIFIPSAACLGNNIQFIDTSTIATGDTIALSTWDFGDSTSGVGDTVNHIYANSGTYTVTLTVTSLTSCDTSISQTITVLESPTAGFTSTDVCMNAPMYFYNNSITPVGTTIDSVIWDFGDSSLPAYGDTVVHGYSSPGIFNVTLTVINNFGCSGTTIQPVNVYAIPVASFTTNSPVCTGNAVNFTNTSTVQNDTIIDFDWNFGDSFTDTIANPIHIYNLPLTYTVSLIVKSLHGCQATVSQNVTVNQSPSFSFTDSLYCLGDTTHFTYIPLNSAPVSGWLWDFGDGAGSILPNPKHPYDSAGVYNVSLVVTAINGCDASVSQFVTINPKPIAGITSDSVTCFGTTMTFNDNSSISSGVINQWFWDFGDGSSIENTQNTIHTYSNDTTFNLIHTVVSDAGCSDNIGLVITVAPMPVANFTPDPSFGSPPLLVQFINSSVGAVSYQWNFGDGGTDIVFSPSHSYSDTGYYEVMLIATNSFLCSDTAYGYISALIPYLDLAIKEVHATQLNNLLSLSSDLVNLGNQPIHKFQISAKIENGIPVNEQWTSASPLNPGESMPFTFASRYEIDPSNVPSFYCIEISEVNDLTDAVESNNKKCSAITDLFELFDIYPNPTSDQINISMNVPLDGTINISIYNAAGQLMKRNDEIAVSKGYNEFNYSIRHFAKGVYACMVKYRDDERVIKIAKK